MDSTEKYSEIFWYHTELNGLPERMTDYRGDVIWRGRFSIWGKTEYENSGVLLDVLQNLRFQGQYLDRESGLHYNLFRYYDPAGGRFTQSDPIGLAGGLNTYAYVGDPLTWVDPLGLTNCNIVKRAVTPEQMASIESGNGIVRPMPYHKTTPTQHVAGAPHSRDPWISTTRSQKSLKYFATHGGTRPANPIIEIDLTKISKNKILDVSTAQKAAENLQTPFTRNAAAAHQEVLIFGEIPHEAIILK